MRTGLRLGALAAALVVSAGPAAACPVCESDTGKQVRAGIFGEEFGTNVVLTLLPFPVLAGLVAVIHFSFPNPKPAANNKPSGSAKEASPS